MPVLSQPASALVKEISDRLSGVRQRIGDACARSGRDVGEVRLIGITKGFPNETVRAAIAAGLTDLGENRVQELEEKVSALGQLREDGAVHWHLVGSLQRNKARRAVEIVDAFHALDSLRLAEELDKRAAASETVLPCYVQVNVSGEVTKSGVDPEKAHDFVEAVADLPHLSIVGLMTLASPAETEDELEAIVRPQLRRLARLARGIDASGDSRLPSTLRLSMGMSGDFEVAIEEGATDIRLGTILFGDRYA
jgi:PLP dependent protein